MQLTRYAALATVGVVVSAAWPAIRRAAKFPDDPEPTDAGTWEIYGLGSGTSFDRGIDGENGLDPGDDIHHGLSASQHRSLVQVFTDGRSWPLAD